ncbi:hypothetical protein LPY66_14280 [Dehalobacter sp. DCM]|uniref:hypothetical protein n=1 Tax=Dehalobacter sp. DCM TaxID=2907827 RepID=UPI0030814B97|nr:hypothetical protein LPY66_14280 [Dehalobacter sp. DCM]
MDFITFIIIAIVVYSIFSKKDKPPQRRPMNPLDNGPLSGSTADEPKKKGRNIFGELERQLREAEQRFEREIRDVRKNTETTEQPKTFAYRTADKKTASAASKTLQTAAEEGDWGIEGRSDYDTYVSTQGTQGTEGVAGTEGEADAEGTWGTEGAYYAEKQAASKTFVQDITAVSSVQATSSQPKPAFNLGFSSSEITRGVIWNEILSEPRARRPFQSRVAPKN